MGLFNDSKLNALHDSATGMYAGVIFLCPGFRTGIYILNRC